MYRSCFYVIGDMRFTPALCAVKQDKHVLWKAVDLEFSAAVHTRYPSAYICVRSIQEFREGFLGVWVLAEKITPSLILIIAGSDFQSKWRISFPSKSRFTNLNYKSMYKPKRSWQDRDETYKRRHVTKETFVTFHYKNKTDAKQKQRRCSDATATSTST